jgi:hypothetical protein
MLKNTASVAESIVAASGDEPDVEVEISAEDLLALSPPQPAAIPDAAASTSLQPLAPEVSAPAVKSPQPPTQASAASKPRASRTRTALWLCGVTALAVIAIALYTFVTPVRASRPLAAATPTEVAQEDWPPPPIPEEVEVEVEGEPVRFVNPFDKDEVFEFPEGTTQAEAHAAVAELLAKRAMERQDRLGAELQRNRKK